MVSISLSVRSIGFVTEQGVEIPARRLFAAANFVGRRGRRIPMPSFLDTGAPYSVIPFGLASRIQWNDVGHQATLPGRKSQKLEWFGVPCHMGVAQVELIDLERRIRTHPLRVLAKVLSRAAPAALEQLAVLGMSFPTDNSIRFELDSTGTRLSGVLWIP
jgi:hypothetical protein